MTARSWPRSFRGPLGPRLAVTAAGLRCLLADGPPPLHRVVHDPDVGQAAPRGAGPARRERRAGQVALRDRLGKRPGSQRGPLTGPNPTDRGKLGSKIHVICDRNGPPISVGISDANLHDSRALIPLMRGIPPIRSR
ncbi:transposase [Streptomyces coelicoflavus]